MVLSFSLKYLPLRSALLLVIVLLSDSLSCEFFWKKNDLL